MLAGLARIALGRLQHLQRLLHLEKHQDSSHTLPICRRVPKSQVLPQANANEKGRRADVEDAQMYLDKSRTSHNRNRRNRGLPAPPTTEVRRCAATPLDGCYTEQCMLRMKRGLPRLFGCCALAAGECSCAAQRERNDLRSLPRLGRAPPCMTGRISSNTVPLRKCQTTNNAWQSCVVRLGASVPKQMGHVIKGSSQER